MSTIDVSSIWAEGKSVRSYDSFDMVYNGISSPCGSFVGIDELDGYVFGREEETPSCWLGILGKGIPDEVEKCRGRRGSKEMLQSDVRRAVI